MGNYEKYKSAFIEIYEEFIEKINNKIEKFRKNGLPIGYISYYSYLKRKFQTIGIGDLVLYENKENGKINFYKASVLANKIFEDRVINEYVYSEEWRYQLLVDLDSLYYAILSDNEEVIKEMLKYVEEFEIEEDNYEEDYTYNYVCAVKLLCKEDRVKAKECIDIMKKAKDTEVVRRTRQKLRIIDAIANDDCESFNKEINDFCIKNRKNKLLTDTPKILMCIEGLALAKIARYNGMNVILDKEIDGVGILEKSEIEYPVIDYI